LLNREFAAIVSGWMVSKVLCQSNWRWFIWCLLIQQSQPVSHKLLCF